MMFFLMIFRSYANVYQRVTSLILQRPEVSPGPLGRSQRLFRAHQHQPRGIWTGSTLTMVGYTLNEWVILHIHIYIYNCLYIYVYIYI